ncbi:MAG TPA: DUF4184 family protein [Terracidiphilus sp.]|jgi:hypothetical protein
MPFTISHAAAALPFRHTRLVASAVIAGCFAPDFEYFLRFGPSGGFGHTLPGLFILDLPLAFIGLWLFHLYAKEPLVESLPEGVRERLQVGPKSLSINSFSRFALIAISILVGEATHILWDSLTHPRYWLYNHWDFLRTRVQIPIFGRQQYCNIFQYVSSVLGVLLILFWCFHWYRSSPPIQQDLDKRTISASRMILTVALILAVVAGFFRAVASGVPNGLHGSQRFTTQSVVTAISVFWIEVVVYGFFRSRRAQLR